MNSRPAFVLAVASVLLLRWGQAGAATAPFDAALEARVLSDALGFMTPRILDPVPPGTLARWGLGGIAALDPSMEAVESGRSLVLSTPSGPIWHGPLPPPDDEAGWSQAAASMAAAAVRASPEIAGAGQTGVTQSFFDELFNHLDPYSRYVAPAGATAERDRLDGSVGNIGAALIATGHGLVLGAVVPDGPAAASGLASGDRLLAVDGADVRRLAPDAALALLGGPVGSTVTLRVRTGGARSATVAIVREAVPPETVFGTSADGLLLLRISGFSRDTAEELSALLDSGLRDHPAGLVIDLRGNRGGFLQQAVTAAALFLDNGVATVTEGRYPQANHVWIVQGGDVTQGLPIAVLVDGRTASAAEILASALADHRRAVVVGSSTLGKGLVQTMLPLPDGGELFVTWSRVLAPLGWPLQGLGVLPQLCTSGGATSVADQMRSLDGGVSLLAAGIGAERASRPPLPIARILEIRDACPAAIGTDEDVDAARTLLADRTAYAAALASVPPLD